MLLRANKMCFVLVLVLGASVCVLSRHAGKINRRDNLCMGMNFFACSGSCLVVLRVFLCPCLCLCPRPCVNV